MTISLEISNALSLSNAEVANIQSNLDTIQANFAIVSTSISQSLADSNLQVLSNGEVANIQSNLDIIEANFNKIQADINSGGGDHVNIDNPLNFIYVKGNDTTDGSIRLLPTSNGEDVEFSLRTAGVWNDTGIQISASTISIGRELKLSAAGDFLYTRDIELESDALIPHVPFSELGGTQELHVPLLSPLIQNFPVQPDFSSEVITNSYVSTTPASTDALLKAVHLKTGSVAATAPVVVSYYKGNDATGVLFWQRTFPASAFAANIDVRIDLLGLVELEKGESIHITYVSDNNFSRRTNLAGVAYALADVYLFSEVVAMDTNNMDRVIIGQNGDAMSDGFGNLMLDGGPLES